MFSSKYNESLGDLTFEYTHQDEDSMTEYQLDGTPMTMVTPKNAQGMNSMPQRNFFKSERSLVPRPKFTKDAACINCGQRIKENSIKEISIED